MAIRFTLLSVCLALCILSLHNANAYSVADWQDMRVRLSSFSWTDCGAASLPAHVKSLAVSPDPVTIPGNLTISTSFTLATTGPTDPSLALIVEKKIAGFYVKVPCVDDIGSCTFQNICTDWAEACPKYFAKYGLPCTCPIPANTYTANGVELYVTIKLPPGSSGDYRITANINSASAGNIVCLQLLASAIVH